MRTGLIGHSGFVGGVLKASHEYTDLYNSKNFREMAGKRFDTLVCAGVSAAKWAANNNPEQDWESIARLIEVLDQVDAGEFILISTIDVYPDTSLTLDERADIDPKKNHPYGRHRLQLERWIAQRFSLVRIVRLPALFGPGLKKNPLFDLLHNNRVEMINPAGLYQWYPLKRLWPDMEVVRARDHRIVNLFPEPLPMRRIIDGFFPGANVMPENQPAPVYRLKSCYASHFGGKDGYIMSAEDCYRAIGAFVRGT